MWSFAFEIFFFLNFTLYGHLDALWASSKELGCWGWGSWGPRVVR